MMDEATSVLEESSAHHTFWKHPIMCDMNKISKKSRNHVHSPVEWRNHSVVIQRSTGDTAGGGLAALLYTTISSRGAVVFPHEIANGILGVGLSKQHVGNLIVSDSKESC